jgi:hypothetical protein
VASFAATHGQGPAGTFAGVLGGAGRTGLR